MNALTIFERNGNLWTDSREVAAMIGKDHKNLIRDIRGYIEVMEKTGKLKIEPSDFFVESTYISEQNKEVPCFDISKKGCEFVANKLTGEKGVLFTAAYVTQFNAYEDAAKAGALPNAGKSTSAIAQLRLQSQAILELDERTATVETKLVEVEDKVDNQIVIDHGQQRALQGIIGKKAYERAAVIFPPDQVKENVKVIFPAIYRDLKNRFGVASYRDVRRKDLADAIKFVEAWIEPANLRNKDANTQFAES